MNSSGLSNSRSSRAADASMATTRWPARMGWPATEFGSQVLNIEIVPSHAIDARTKTVIPLKIANANVFHGFILCYVALMGGAYT